LHCSPSQQLTVKELLALKIFAQSLYGSVSLEALHQTNQSLVLYAVAMEIATQDLNAYKLEILNNASLKIPSLQTKILNS
jgi:hypothetical protein